MLLIKHTLLHGSLAEQRWQGNEILRHTHTLSLGWGILPHTLRCWTWRTWEMLWMAWRLFHSLLIFPRMTQNGCSQHKRATHTHYSKHTFPTYLKATEMVVQLALHLIISCQQVLIGWPCCLPKHTLTFLSPLTARTLPCNAKAIIQHWHPYREDLILITF